MNKQGKGKIEWCDWTINPVKGKCLHGCSYCYANAIHDRFKWNTKVRFEPRILEQIVKAKKPSKIFIGSMHDLFGNWIKKEWIEKIIEVTKKYPQHTFQFLTKNPKRYLEFDFPKNCWLGVTIDYNKLAVCDQQEKINVLDEKRMNYTFISFEPLLDNMSDLDLEGVDLVIVGAMTGQGVIKPEKEWIKSIKHHNIFYKDNIKKYL